MMINFDSANLISNIKGADEQLLTDKNSGDLVTMDKFY